jgi:hypothetical protein
MPRLVDLVRSATPAQAREASDLAGILKARNFQPNDIDDLVYAVATRVCAELVSETDSDASPEQERAALAEYTAADEINLESMSQQLQLLVVWHDLHKPSPLPFREHLALVLRIRLDAPLPPLPDALTTMLG